MDFRQLGFARMVPGCQSLSERTWYVDRPTTCQETSSAMCHLLTVGVSGGSGNPTEIFRAHGLHAEPAVNPHVRAAMLVADTGGLLRALARTPKGDASFPEHESGIDGRRAASSFPGQRRVPCGAAALAAS
jgi:hypothetical protein